MLVALMMEGKFSREGLQAFDTDEDLLSAMASELVEKAASENPPMPCGANWVANVTECCPEIKNWCLSPRASRFVCLKLRIRPHRRLCRAPLGCRCSNQVRHRGSAGRYPSG
jgi:hypothetical protein